MCSYNCPSKKSLGILSCEKNYISVSGFKYFHENMYLLSGYKESIAINDVKLYKNSFPSAPDSMPFGEIDFTTHTLLAAMTDHYSGVSASSQGTLCFNPLNSKWMFKVEYTYLGDCESDGRPFLSAILTPKLPAGAIIEFKIININ